MKKQDIIFIKKLKIETYLGIDDWEQTTKQPIMLNIKIGMNNKAAKTNNINDTINYREVYEKIVVFVGRGKFQLIENLAEQLANLVLESFPATIYVRVQVTKPQALKDALAGVIVERSKDK
jgi:dihydroneopterin aldolase